MTEPLHKEAKAVASPGVTPETLDLIMLLSVDDLGRRRSAKGELSPREGPKLNAR